jgi:hypothetical protein
MARFPLRALGFLLLTVTILGASCQAVFAGGASLLPSQQQIELWLGDLDW